MVGGWGSLVLNGTESSQEEIHPVSYRNLCGRTSYYNYTSSHLLKLFLYLPCTGSAAGAGKV